MSTIEHRPATAGMLTLVVALSVFPARAAEPPAFVYDPSKTATYLNETLGGPGAAPATELRRELSAVVDEILDGPWQPLFSDYSAGEAGGVGVAEWCFNRPGQYVLALSQAAPYMTVEQKTKARTFLHDLVTSSPPTRQVYLDIKAGKPRNIRRDPPPSNPRLSDAESQQALFAEGYALWACASALDAWGDVRPMFEDLKKLRGRLEQRGDLEPAYAEGHAGPLTAADAKDPQYRFEVYQSLLAGCQDNYWYRGARQARARMQKDRPVFFYVETLSALIGYHRLAIHFRQSEESQWASRTFDHVATLTLSQKSAPYLWSDPRLSPEVGRLIRDAAGPWLDELTRTPNVGVLPATDWDGKVVPGKRDFYVMDPYTWFHAWGGQGEAIRPRTVLGAFLVNAWLFDAPAEKVAETLDVPWCKADLYYARKLAVAIRAAEKARWERAK